MRPLQILAILLVLGGVLALVYGGFSYTEEQHEVGIGPVELQVREKERVDVPSWLGVGAVVIGAALLLVRARKTS